ncbi:MAG: high-potential iron-sulfur protein [Halofilum sp. (in: g-proteobacteria)]|nr:high-potential iron-sulfur protein [Halofilum sp. (in: g-proteobacteria)]
MTDQSVDARRRRFMRLALAAATATPVAGLLGARGAAAAELPKLDPASERARRFDYTHDASSSDNPAHEAGARCANCTHFRGEAGAQWAPCNIFPRHRVKAGGWCTSWFSAG